MYMHCHALTIRQLPSCNLFTQHVSYLLWRDTTSELWTPVHSFTLIKQPQTANCFFFILCNLILIFHTIRLILCFQQASEIDNLTVSLGQSSLIVLCADSTSTVQTPINNTIFLAPLTTFWRVAAPTGSITLVSFWGKTCCWLHHTFLLGSPNERVFHVIKLFFWRRCRGDSSLLQGEFHASNLFTLFLSCLVYFILSCLLSIIKNTKKLVTCI